MKVSDMTPEQREAKRKYDREQKAKNRAAKKEALRKAQMLSADEASESFASEHPERVRELDQYVKEFASAVSTELGRPLDKIEEQFVLDRVSRCLVGLKRGWIQRVLVGSHVAELVSGSYFADSCMGMVEDANRFGLRKSLTFNTAYTELLKLVITRYGSRTPVTEDIQVARAELAGEYELPEPPETPAPEPNRVPDVRVPSTAEILFSARQKLLEQI